jgi:hypothetical protein
MRGNLKVKNEFVADRYKIECTCMGLTTLELFRYCRHERPGSVVKQGGDKPHPYISEMWGDYCGREALVCMAFLLIAFPFFRAFSSGG